MVVIESIFPISVTALVQSMCKAWMHQWNITGFLSVNSLSLTMTSWNSGKTGSSKHCS